MNRLDDFKKIKEIDTNELYKHILALPNSLQKAYQDLVDFKVTSGFGSFKNIVIGGMGGSGVAANIVNDLVDLRIPAEVVNDYHLPRWVGGETLVILVSHSGYTEEVVSLYKEAENMTDKIFVISEGDNGQLERLAKRDGELFYDYDSSVPPRFSLGEQLGALLGLFSLLGLLDKELEIKQAVNFCNNVNKDLGVDVKTEDNMAKILAFKMFDHVPIIVASGVTKTVAYRWQTQFNENSKSFSYHLVFPEAAHNAVTGIGLPRRSRDDLFFILLKNKFGNKHTQKRIDLLADILDREKVAHEKYDSRGESVLEQVLSTLLLGDWISYYLAILNDVDPGETDNIEWMKKIIKQQDNKSINQYDKKVK